MTQSGSNKIPILSTDRLELRQLKIEDDKGVFALRSNEKVNKFLDRPTAKTLSDARNFIKNINEGIQNKEWFYWAICKKSNKQFIGTICIWNIFEENAQAEIGFELLPEFQGNGFMTEALKEVTAFGFNELGFQSIVGIVHPGNFESIRLLKKFGFIEIGKINDSIIFRFL